MAKSVAIRLATEGKAQVKNDFAEIAQSGEVSARRLAATYDEQVKAAERAAERAARTAEKIAAIAPQTPMQMQVNSAVGSNVRYQSASGGIAGDFEGSARRSAAAMKDLIAEEERLEQRTRALLSAIDPVWAAQDRFNREMAEAKALLDAGRISTEQYAAASVRAKAGVDAVANAQGRGAQMSGLARAGYQQLSYQVGDVTQQLAMGVNPAVVFGQQMNQVVQALMLIGDASNGAARGTETVSRTSDAATRATIAQVVATDSLRSATQSAVTPIAAVAGAAAAEAEALGAATGASTSNTSATAGNATAHRASATAMGQSAAAAGADAVAQGADAAATGANTVATSGLSAAKARLLTFMAGPWGAAVIGGVTVLGLLASKMEWTGDAVDKATEKLVKQAKEAETTRLAEERYSHSQDGVRKAILDTVAAREKALESSRTAAEQANIAAKENLKEELSIRKRTIAQLEWVKALLDAQRARASGPTQAGEIAALGLPQLQAAHDDLAKRLADQNSLVVKAEAELNATRADLADEAAKRAIDPVEQIKRKYEGPDGLIEQAKKKARAEGQVTAELTAQLTLLRQQEATEIKRAQEQQRARSDSSATRFTAPLRSMNVTHPFGERRGNRSHGGVDLDTPVGTTAYADADGVVRHKNDPNGYGRYIELDHGRGVKSRYGHLSSFLVPDGTRVQQGAPIALTGGEKGALGAGNSSAAHLHYEVRKGGKPVNPIGGAFGIDPLAANSGGGENRAETLRRQAEAMEASAKGALALAEAYLKSGEAAVRAEAQREGATDAIRSGAEAEAQVRRQLNLDISEGAAQGAKAVAGMREETSARATINDGVSTGAIAVADMNRALSDEAALRPLLKLQALAQGEALTTLTKVIEAYRKALADAHNEEARGQALAAIDASAKRIEDIRAMIPLVGDPAAREIEEARRSAIREADAKGLKPTDIERTDLIDSRVDEARAEQALRRAEYVAGAKRDGEDSVALLRLELELLGESDKTRERSLRRLAYELELNRELGPEYAEQINELLRRAEVEESLRSEIEKTRDSLEEARQIGESFVDTLFDPRNWKDWGDLGKRILNDLAEDMIRLAILNPIKNELFGQNNPTASGVFSALGQLFGGSGGSQGGDAGAAGAGFWDSLGSAFGSANAMGTEYFSGGLTRINENGDELVELPRGAKIRTAAETRRLLAANDTGMTIRPTWNIDARGADSAAIMRLERMMADYSDQFGENVVAAVNDGIARRMIVAG